MAKFIYAELPEFENTPVIINVERANYVVFDEKEESAVFWFGKEDAYSIPAKKNVTMDLIQSLGIPIFNRP